MQIELIGCTSAGKSTLSKRILQACQAQKLEALLGDDFVLRQARLNWIESRPLRKALVNLAGLLASLITWRKNREFYQFAAQHLFRLPIGRLEKFQLLRNVLKKIGIYEIIRRRRSDQEVILVDEGILQVAHNLFVHVSVEAKTEELATFAGLIPLPDVVVYLKQPEELLIDRTLKRGHQRIPDRSYGQVVSFIKQAVATFDNLVRYPAVENKLLIINGEQDVVMAKNEPDDPMVGMALRIVQSIFSGESSGQPARAIYVE